MRHLFIINPAAGRPESTARLEALLSRLSFPHEVAYTREAGDAQRLAATAVRTGGPVRIYACGGDGTLNEVVNGAAGFDNAAVTCVPKGTGNDFLKLFGPRFRELFNDLEALAAGPQRAFDLMDCNGKLGLDVVCAGVDARIAAGVHRYKDLRFVSGIGAYLLSLPLQSIRSKARWGPAARASRSEKPARQPLPKMRRKSLAVPLGTLVTATWSCPAAPHTTSLRVPSPPQA